MSEKKINVPGEANAKPAPAAPTPPAKPAPAGDANADAMAVMQQQLDALSASNQELRDKINRKPAVSHAPTSKQPLPKASSVDAEKIDRAVLTDEGYVCPVAPAADKK